MNTSADMNMAKTHPLFIAEICRQIARRICETEPRSLVSLALTCRSFTEIALNVLWETHASLHALFYVLPSDLWMPKHIIPDLKDLRYMTFRRSLEESDWSRFDYYSRKMRKLIQGECPLIHDSIVLALVSYRPARVLMPRLHTFVLQEFGRGHSGPKTPNIVPLLHASFGTSLTHIEIDADLRDPTIPSLLVPLSRTSPNISSFVCSSRKISSEALASLNVLLRNLHKLQNLDFVPSLEWATVLHLGRLTSLQEWAGYLTSSQHNFPEGKLFPSLVDLDLDVDKPCLDAAIALFESSASSLAKLILRVCHDAKGQVAPRSSLHRLVAAIPSTAPANTLAELTLEIGPYLGVQGVPATTLLQPLFSLRSLIKVELLVDLIHELGDPFLKAASASWPSLQHLSIIPHERRMRPSMTLAGLIPIANSCQDLASLNISLLLKPLNLPSSAISPNPSLKSIHFSYSPLEYPSRVFHDLVVMFPRLEELICKKGREEDEKVWQVFEDAVSHSGRQAVDFDDQFDPAEDEGSESGSEPEL